MKFFLTILLLLTISMIYAEDKFSAGLTAGYQYDTGLLSEKNGIQSNVQQNISAGVVLKLNMSKVFLRSGAEYSYPYSNGKIANNTAGSVTETAVTFIEVPVYGGINLPIRDFGAFYIGAGGSYIFGSGHITTTGGNVKINEQLFGYGLLVGIESEIYSNASLLLEWEYMAARSSPVASTLGVYKDYSIDYSGNKIRFGIMYHFNR